MLKYVVAVGYNKWNHDFSPRLPASELLGCGQMYAPIDRCKHGKHKNKMPRKRDVSRSTAAWVGKCIHTQRIDIPFVHLRASAEEVVAAENGRREARAHRGGRAGTCPPVTPFAEVRLLRSPLPLPKNNRLQGHVGYLQRGGSRMR